MVGIRRITIQVHPPSQWKGLIIATEIQSFKIIINIVFTTARLLEPRQQQETTVKVEPHHQVERVNLQEFKPASSVSKKIFELSHKIVSSQPYQDNAPSRRFFKPHKHGARTAGSSRQMV